MNVSWAKVGGSNLHDIFLREIGKIMRKKSNKKDSARVIGY